jgi:mannosyltransferase
VRLRDDRTLLIAGAISALALALRLWGIGRESIWEDEAYTWKVAQLPVSTILSLPEQTPPLYNLLMHFWVQLAGTSPTALRIPSALLGSATVGVVFLLGRRLLGEAGGLAAASLAALSPIDVAFSQTARTYALFSFATALSYLMLVRALETPSRRRFAGYAAATALMLYSHVYGIFFLGAQAVFVVWRLRRPADRARLKAWMLGAALAVAAFAPWSLILVQRAHEVAQQFWITRPSWGTAPWTVESFASNGEGWRIAGVVDVLALAFIALALYGSGLLGRRRGEAEPARLGRPSSVERSWMLGLALLIPIVVPVVLSWVAAPFFVHYYALPGALALVLLAAAGIAAIPRQAVATASLTGLLLLSGVALAHQEATPRNDDWRDAVAFVDAHASGGELVVMHEGLCVPGSLLDLQCPWEYYTNRTDLAPIAFLPDYHKTSAADMPAFDQLVGNRTSVWVMYRPASDPDGVLGLHLRQSFGLPDRSDFAGLVVDHYAR